MVGGRARAAVAADDGRGTKLADPQARKALLEGGTAAVEASTDPMIVLARKVDPLARAFTEWFEDNVQGVEQAAGEKLGRAQFLVYGKSIYPDSTFTLRLSYGTVAGYPMNGTRAPSRTTFYGLYDRANSFDFAEPFSLTARWKQSHNRMRLSTPLDFADTYDSGCRRSAYPLINRR